METVHAGAITGNNRHDTDRTRRTGQSLSSGGLATTYGFTDLDGSTPDCWRYGVEVQDAGKPADATGYRLARSAAATATWPRL